MERWSQIFVFNISADYDSIGSYEGWWDQGPDSSTIKPTGMRGERGRLSYPYSLYSG